MEIHSISQCGKSSSLGTKGFIDTGSFLIRFLEILALILPSLNIIWNDMNIFQILLQLCTILGLLTIMILFRFKVILGLV